MHGSKGEYFLRGCLRDNKRILFSFRVLPAHNGPVTNRQTPCIRYAGGTRKVPPGASVADKYRRARTRSHTYYAYIQYTHRAEVLGASPVCTCLDIPERVIATLSRAARSCSLGKGPGGRAGVIPSCVCLSASYNSLGS